MYNQPFHTKDISKLSFLVTGGAGFIGSNIVEYLIKYNAGKVIVLDNLSNGYKKNIEKFIGLPNFEFIEGDITNFETCKELPKVEEKIGTQLSPYAVSKKTKELYANVFALTYGLDVVGLRYFNVFGPNQSPNGPYAAAIPLFMDAVLKNESPFINGNGEQSRDFTFVENVVQANIKALFTEKDVKGKVMNIAFGGRTTINDLFFKIRNIVGNNVEPIYREARLGDVKDSLAAINLAQELIDYHPSFSIDEGLKITIDWFKHKVLVD